jgi:hypothetical protein
MVLVRHVLLFPCETLQGFSSLYMLGTSHPVWLPGTDRGQLEAGINFVSESRACGHLSNESLLTSVLHSLLSAILRLLMHVVQGSEMSFTTQ